VREDLKSIPSGVAQRNSVDPTGEPTFLYKRKELEKEKRVFQSPSRLVAEGSH